MQKLSQSIVFRQQAKIFTVGLSFFLVWGFYACGKGINSGINLKNLNIGANVTQIQKITQNGQETYDSQTPERKTNMAELARQYIQLNEEREKIDNTINDYQTLDQQQIQGDLTANKNYYSFLLIFQE